MRNAKRLKGYRNTHKQTSLYLGGGCIIILII